MVAKKVPLRKCLGCMESFPKKELIRVVKNKEGEFAVDLKGKMNGRGAYLCKNPACLEKAIKQKRLERAFECAIPPEVYERLREELLADG